MSQRILVVDDDQDTLNLMALTLKQYGFEAIKAQSGPRALDLLAHDLPDLVILDVMMPQMDGIDVCRLIRADPRTAHLPVVMLTARAESGSQVESFRAGADDYITKPVSPNELIERIREVLSRPAGGPPSKTMRAIAVAGAKGGVGVTTLAVNLALLLAKEARTVLVDLNADGSASIHLGLNSIHGWGDLLSRDSEAIDGPSVESALLSHFSGLRLLASSEQAVDPARALAVFNRLRSACEFCVLDLGAGLSPTARAIGQHSDDLLLVFDSDRATLLQANRLMRAWNDAGVSEDALKLIWVNRLGTGTDVAGAAIRAVFGYDPAAIIDPASEALYQALERGQPLVTSQPQHPAAVQMSALAVALVNPK